jgi:TRAP-type transport system periplasmic protein
MKGLKVRVMGAPIWSRTFCRGGHVALGDRLQRDLQRDPERVISAGNNEAAGVEQMKFYEVGPNLSMTEHQLDSTARLP